MFTTQREAKEYAEEIVAKLKPNRKGIKFKVSFIVEAEFDDGVTEEDACEIIEEAVAAIIDDAGTGRKHTMHGGALHGKSVKLDDFVHFTAELEERK